MHAQQACHIWPWALRRLNLVRRPLNDIWYNYSKWFKIHSISDRCSHAAGWAINGTCVHVLKDIAIVRIWLWICVLILWCSVSLLEPKLTVQIWDGVWLTKGVQLSNEKVRETTSQQQDGLWNCWTPWFHRKINVPWWPWRFQAE
jgi:hypothetical protein